MLNMNTLNFTEKENLKLVREVEKRPHLYNINLLAHRQKKEIDKAWEEIGAVLNLPARTCKWRWKNIRSVLARNKRSKELYRNNTKPYYLTDATKFVEPFLLTYLSPKPNKASKKYKIEPIPKLDEIEQPSTSTINSAGKTIEKLPRDLVESPGHSTDTEIDDEAENIQLYNLIESRSNSDMSVSDEEFDVSSSSDAKDPVQSFLESLAPELKDMTFVQFKKFKRKVFTLIDDIKK